MRRRAVLSRRSQGRRRSIINDAKMMLLRCLISGLLLLGLSQIIDGIDGGVARKYGLESKEGKLFELLFDRLNELAIFLALVIAGYATLLMAVLAFVAILCVSLVEPYSHFDPGFKRFVIYFGYMASVLFQVRGFEIALNVIFFTNLAGFVAGTIMADYRLQRDIDIQSIIRREMEIEAGIPQPPPDPPSLLSKLFA